MAQVGSTDTHHMEERAISHAEIGGVVSPGRHSFGDEVILIRNVWKRRAFIGRVSFVTSIKSALVGM